jgi:CspA family cold shock protein
LGALDSAATWSESLKRTGRGIANVISTIRCGHARQQPTWKTGRVISVGVVRDFRPEQGWGIIDGPDVPGGCWVHFSAIVMDGYRQLMCGQRVSFRAEAANQNGFTFRATKVWPDGAEPTDPPAVQKADTAYRSSLNLTFDQPDDLRKR